MAKNKSTPKTTKSGNSTLNDHSRSGTKLSPPLAQLPNLELSSWMDNRLPEMLWAVLIVSQFDQHPALKIMADAVSLFGELKQEKRVLEPDAERVSVECDVTHTGLSQLEESVCRSFVDRLARLEGVKVALRPLLLFDDLPARSVWAEAIDQTPQPADWEVLMGAVALTLNHQSQESTDCRYMRLMATILGGRMIVPPSILDEYAAYPNVELRKVRPSIRASEGGMSNLISTVTTTVNPAEQWSCKFWTQCLRDTLSCSPFGSPIFR